MENSESGPFVLVTGASTGIGSACAIRLDRAGFRVFAGIRKEVDGQRLKALGSPRLAPVVIDVTSGTSIGRAFEVVRDKVGEAGLAGLVNNAGIGIASPVECLPLVDLRRMFEVNVFGQVAVTQAFLPLVRKAKGRIVNLGSVGDRLSIPFGGALCASKSAFAALSESLRLELAAWGIKVCLIEPASISTPAVDKLEEESRRAIEALPEEGARLYAARFREFLRRAVEREKRGSPPEVVAEVVLKALTARNPKTRYPVGADVGKLMTLARWVPDPLLDRIRLRIFGLS